MLTKKSLAAALAIPAALAVLLLSGHGAHAQAAAVYSGGGEADGLRTTVTLNNFLVVSQLADVGIPTASTTIDSLGDSNGFASYPYPGALAVTAGGLLESNGGPQVPPYPFYVSSSWPGTPKATNDAGPYSISSSSTPTATDASGTSSAAIGQLTTGLVSASSKSAFDEGSQTVTATSQSTLDSIDVGVLRIGRAVSTAEAVAGPKGSSHQSANFEASGITVNGVTVGLDSQGLVLAGTTTPLPPSSSLSQALAQSGISVHYLAGYTDQGEVVSPGVRIDTTQNLPGGATAVISYFIGEATAHAQLASQGSTASVGLPATIPAPGAPASTSSGSSGAAGIVGTAPSPNATGERGTSAIGAQGTSSTGAQGTIPTTGQGAGVAGAPQQMISARGAVTFSGTAFYAILVLAAIAAVGGVQLIRVFAVRQSWGR